MFGNKQEKQERLDQEVAILKTQGEMSVAELAELIGVPPKTIYSDLLALDDNGIQLQEHKGKVSLYQDY